MPHATCGLVPARILPWGPVQLDIANRGLTVAQRTQLYNGQEPGGVQPLGAQASSSAPK